MSGEGTVLELQGVTCVRPEARLAEVNLCFARGTITFLVGDAGGAELLLRVASLQELRDAGAIVLENAPVPCRGGTECEQLRNRHFGYVYSAPYVLPGLSVVENVAMPLLRVLGIHTENAAEKTDEVLEFTRLGELASDDAGTLPRFDQHRVALARALVHEPRVLVLERAEAGLCPEEATRFWGFVERACVDRKLCVLATVLALPAPARTHRVISVESGSVSELSAPFLK